MRIVKFFKEDLFNEFLGYSINIDDSFKSGPVILSKINERIFEIGYYPPKEIEFNYENYVSFVNSDFLELDKTDISFKLHNNLKLSILAFDRISNLNKNILKELNFIISNEIKNLEKNHLKDILESRKKISMDIYQFKRFKIEFGLLNYGEFSGHDFTSIEKDVEEIHYFFKDLLNVISKRIQYVDNTIDTLNQNSNLILNLKNIENSNKLQILTKNLTWLIVGLTIILVFLTIFLHYY